MAPIGLALIGGGIFIKEYHLPAVQATDALALKAIYSRSAASAQATADLLTSSAKPDLYSDDSGAGRALDDLLARDDISAVIIALPIALQTAFITRALAAGKHVLAEKPVGPDVATARKLVDGYRSSPPPAGATLAIAENYRFDAKWSFANSAVRALGGKIIGFHLHAWSMQRPGGKYFETEWRKNPTHQGGFVLDGGVHSGAALRFVLAGAAGEGLDAPAEVVARTALNQAHLPPFDAASAVVKTRSGAVGTFSLHFGSPVSSSVCHVVCDGGSVTVEARSVKVTTLGVEGEPKTETKDFNSEWGNNNGSNSVTNEVRAWAESILKGEPNPLQSPELTLGDLEFMEAIFSSAEQGGTPVKLEYQ